jgi:hypothetical protein
MPFMLSSISQDVMNQSKLDSRGGEIQKGDTIILATDAVAKWIIQECKAFSDVCRYPISLESDELRSYFGGLIENGKMKNDDITMLELSF